MNRTRRELAFLFPALAAAQRQHGYRNQGSAAAKYFVLALGND